MEFTALYMRELRPLLVSFNVALLNIHPLRHLYTSLQPLRNLDRRSPFTRRAAVATSQSIEPLPMQTLYVFTNKYHFRL